MAIRVACRTGRAFSPLEAQLVLVDLVNGAGLSSAGVASLRRARGHVPVVALHDHGFGEDPLLHELKADSFCPIGDWSPIIAALTGPHDASS